MRVESVALRLKRLRERSGLSVRKLAAKLEMDFSRYAYFEDPKRFKKAHLAMDLARSIAAVLADHDIDPDEVMALAGLEANESAGPDLSAGEQMLVDHYREMKPAQRRLLLQLAENLAVRPFAEPSRTPEQTPVLAKAA